MACDFLIVVANNIHIDLSNGPMVVEVSAGPIMSVVNDMNQLYVMDIGMPGPDKGKGGKHIILPPNYTGKVPAGYYVGKSTTNRVLILLRTIPQDFNPETGEKLMKSIKVYPLNKAATEINWVHLNDKAADFTPVRWEDNIKYWERLAKFIQRRASQPGLPHLIRRTGRIGYRKRQNVQPRCANEKYSGKSGSNGKCHYARTIFC